MLAKRSISGISVQVFDESYWEDGIRRLSVSLGDDSVSDPASNKGYPGDKVSKATKIARATYWSSENSSNYPHGYLIHARCSDLIKHYVGDISQSNLGVAGHRSEKALVFAVIWPRRTFFLWSRFSGPGADPVDVPAVKTLVQWSTETARCGDLRTRKEGTSTWPQPKRGQFLALDVHRLILDILHCSDVENHAEALGWSTPDCYWRQRAKDSGIIFEYDDVLETTTIDWVLLAKEVEQLANSSIGMQNRPQNRLHVRDILHRVSDLFHSLKRGRGATSLQGFIKETYSPYTGPLKFDLDEVGERVAERMETLPRYCEIPPIKLSDGPRRYS